MAACVVGILVKGIIRECSSLGQALLIRNDAILSLGQSEVLLFYCTVHVFASHPSVAELLYGHQLLMSLHCSTAAIGILHIRYS